MIDNLIRYFDLQSASRTVVPRGQSALPVQAPVLPQYIVVCAGVVLEPYLRNYTTTGSWQVDWSHLLGRVIFGLVVGMILLPSVYKAAFDPKKPLVVQLAALLPLGIGWQSVFASATKLTLG